MSEVEFPSNAKTFSLIGHDSPVIVVTSLRPKRRPLSVRQQRLAEFCYSDASRTEKLSIRRADRDRTVPVATCPAPCKTYNTPNVVLSLKAVKEAHQDEVKVLYPARDLSYSDSEVAILSTCSSWCVGSPSKHEGLTYDTGLSRVVTERNPSLNEIPPKTCSRIGLVDKSSVIGDRFLNKPPGDFAPSEELASISEGIQKKDIQKPYGQVWHNVWEHQAGSSHSAKRSKYVNRLVSREEFTQEQTSSSANNIGSLRIMDRKQRRGVYHPIGPMAHTRLTYRSKNFTRPWGRAFYQRPSSMGARSAQRKASLLKDDVLEHSESLLDRKPKPRRCELSDKKSLPRVLVTRASRPGSAVAAAKEDFSSPKMLKTAPANLKRGTMENANNRSWHYGKPPKPVTRPRFSVPIKASRVPMDLLFKEMNSHKSDWARRDPDTNGRQRPLKYRGVPNRALNAFEQPYCDLNQDQDSCRDARLALHFTNPERSRSPSLQGGRRLFSSPLYNRVDMNIYETNPEVNYGTPVDGNAPHKSIANQSPGSDSLPSQPPPGLKADPTSRLMDSAARWKTTASNVPILNHFYTNSVPSSSFKSPNIVNYKIDTDNTLQSGYHLPNSATGGMLPLFSYDATVSPDYLYDGHFSDQAPKAFRFSHPNAPDVLISPPPNPQLRGDSLCISPPLMDIDSPDTMFNPCVQPAKFPLYYGIRTPETTAEENFIPLQPFIQPNVRPFMPSVDFSRFEPPPRPQSRAFPPGEDLGESQMSHDDNTSFLESLQQVAAKPSLISSLNVKTSKAPKLLLTFGAQVPSSPRISIKSLTSKGLSSARLENQDANRLYSQNVLITSNSRSEDLPSDLGRDYSTNHKNSGGCIVPSILEPNAEQRRKSVNSNIEFIKKTGSITDIHATNDTELREDTMCVPDRNVTVNMSWKSTLVRKVADPDNNLAGSNLFRIVENTLPESCKADSEFATKHIDLTESRAALFREMYSDTKLSTVTEVSAEVLQPGGSPCVEENGFEFNRSYTVDLPEIVLNRNRFQLIEDNNGDTDVKIEETEDCTTKGNAVDTSCNQVVTFASSEVLDSDVHAHTTTCDPCDQGGDHVTDITSASNVAPSRINSITYPAMTCDQLMDKKMSLTDNATRRLESAFEDNHRVANTPLPSNSSHSQLRFQSLVARLNNISSQCKLPGSPGRSPENYSFSEAINSRKSSQPIASIHQEKTGHKDAFVQVPVLCNQSLETEPFTAEKGVPDFRAGLTLKFLSTVVDVPPIVRSTETVGTNTEEKPDEKGLPMREEGMVYNPTALNPESESGLPVSDQICTTSALNADSTLPASSGLSSDSRRPASKVSTTDKQLKPFFRSHRSDLTNIYNLTALHSLRLGTKTDRCTTKRREEKPRRCSTASGEGNLRSDSNTSTELRKDQHMSSCDDDRNYEREHVQPERAAKQHVGDRRVSFRPCRREADIFSSAAYEHSHFEGKCIEKHHRLPNIRVRSLNEEMAPQNTLRTAEDLRQSERIEKLCDIHDTDEIVQEDLKTSTRPASDAVECVETIQTSLEDKSSRCRKSQELPEQSRSSYKDCNFDNVIALKRKPGYAVSQKTRSSVSMKKSILKRTKDAQDKTEPSDIPGSILRLGLSSIVAPIDVGTQNDIVIAAGTFNMTCSEEKPQPVSRSLSSRNKSQYFLSVASMIALEASKKADFKRSGKTSHPKDDCSVVIIQESAAFNQSSKSPRKESLDGKGDPCTYLNYPKHTSETNISTVPTISPKKAHSDYVSTVLPSFPEASSAPVAKTRLQQRNKQTGEESATQDCSLNPSISKRIKHIQPDVLPQSSNPTGTKSKQTRKIIITDCSTVFETGISADHEQSTLNFEKKDHTDVARGLDSSQLSRGCMFTAMRRFMKTRQRPDVSAKKNVPPENSNEYPGFQFTGVPVTESECLSLDRLSYCSHCKCKHLSDQDWPCPGSPEDARTMCKLSKSRGPKECPMDPLISDTYSTKIYDARALSKRVEHNDEFQKASSQGRRGLLGRNAQSKILWQSVCHRTHATTQPVVDPYDSDEVKSGSSGLSRSDSIARNISDDSSSYAVRVSRPPSAEFRRAESLKHVITCELCSQKDCADKVTHGLRTIPPDLESGEEYRLRYPRCASAVASRPFSPRKTGARAASAPADVVRISHGRFWPLPHSVYKVAHGPRRLTHKHVKLLECDSFTCDRCEHRKARQGIQSYIYDDKLHRLNDDVFVFLDDRHSDLGDAYCKHALKHCSCRSSRKDRRK